MIGKHHYLYSFRPPFDKYTMENNLDQVAKDIYGKIQTRFPSIKIGDENATVLSKKSDIPKARFFEFQYEENGNPLGIITITLDEDDGIVIEVSGDLSDDTSSNYHDAYSFIRSFKKFAKNRLLNYTVKNIGKSNLDKRDYEFRAKPKEQNVMESKLYGTNRISYQDLGEARIVVKHNRHIDPQIPGSRSMHIDSIFVENSMGERFKYPSKHLNGARALAEHIKHGGNPYDLIGKHITGLSEELVQLRKFKNYVGRQEQISESMSPITNKVIERIEDIKKQVNQLQKSSFYENFVETFQGTDEKIIPETVMTDWVERLTIRSFNEDIKTVFPYLYNIVESDDIPVRELNPDDLLDETFGKEGLSKRLKKSGFGDTEYWEKGAKEKEIRHTKANDEMAQRADDWNKKFGKKTESLDPETKLTYFFESILNENKDTLFSKNPGTRNAAINAFNGILSNEMAGGMAGVLTLKGIIDDPVLTKKIEVLDSDEEIRDEIKQYILDREPELLNLITSLNTTDPDEIGGEDVPEEPDATEPPPMPAEPVPPTEPTPPMPNEQGQASMPPTPPMQQPIAEGRGKGKKTIIKAKLIKAKTAGANLDTKFTEGMTIRDVMKECGIDPMECGFEDSEQPRNSRGTGVDQLLGIVAGFWNRDERNFTIGGTRAKIKVVKAFEDGECPNATPDDVKRVLMMISMKDPSTDIQEPSQPQGDGREQHMLEKMKTMNTQSVMETELKQIIKNAGLK